MTKRTKVASVVVATAAVLTGVAGYFYFGDQSAPEPPARRRHAPAFESHSRRELREVKAEVAALRAQVSRHDQKVTGSNSEEGRPSALPDPETGTTRPTREEAMLASNERFARRRDSALTALRLEARDDGWATETEQSVEKALASLDKSRFPTTWLDRVRCKQTICEVVVRHDSAREGHSLTEEIVGIKEIRQTFGKTDEEVPGSFVTTVYLGRTGHKLPK